MIFCHPFCSRHDLRRSLLFAAQSFKCLPARVAVGSAQSMDQLVLLIAPHRELFAQIHHQLNVLSWGHGWNLTSGSQNQNSCNRGSVPAILWSLQRFLPLFLSRAASDNVSHDYYIFGAAWIYFTRSVHQSMLRPCAPVSNNAHKWGSVFTHT